MFRLATPALADLSISATDRRLVLFGLIGLLLAILGFIAACAMVLRRRAARDSAQPRQAASTAVAEPAPATVMTGVTVERSLGATLGHGELVAVSADPMACPSCHREFESWLQYCPHDARRLIPAPEMLDRPRTGGAICPECRRAFEPGVRFCPHDGADLVPMSVYEATRGRPPSAEPVGVIGKICPQCNRRYDLASAFCGRDGSELVPLN